MPLTLPDKFEYWCYKNPSKVALYHRFISIICYPFALLQLLLISILLTLLRKIAHCFPSTRPIIQRTWCKYSRPRGERSFCGTSLVRLRQRKHSKMVDIELQYREQALKRRVSLSSGTPQLWTLHTLLKRRPKTYTQSQSPFFTQLPAEIRMKIYALVLTAEPFLHIAFDGPTFAIPPSCQWCKDEDDKEERLMKHMQCMTWSLDQYADDEYAEYCNHAQDRFRCSPLLKSCRRIYTKAINLVYTKNTFILATGLEFSNFARFIPARHFSLIRSLVLYVPSIRRSGHYLELLRILKRMPQLRKCRMFIVQAQGTEVEELLGSLKELATRDAFVVELGSHTSRADRKKGETGFHVTERWVLKDLE